MNSLSSSDHAVFVFEVHACFGAGTFLQEAGYVKICWVHVEHGCGTPS